MAACVGAGPLVRPRPTGAVVAQLVEQRIRNAWVGGSSPFNGTTFSIDSAASLPDTQAGRALVRSDGCKARRGMTRGPMTRRLRSILLIAALAAIVLAAALPLLRGIPVDPPQPPLPSEKVDAPKGASAV